MPERPNVAIFAYPGYTGGKFLINTLGLSDACCFQNIHLVRRQLAGSFSRQDKLDYLLHQLSTTVTWQDLDLGDWQLFGINWHNLVDHPEVFDHDKLLFTTAHDRQRLLELIDKFPNSARVYFIKNNNFFTWRFHNNDRNAEFLNDYIFDRKESIYQWDADDFLNKQIFISKTQKLYASFGLPDFDQVLIETYYDKYMATLEKLRNDSSH